MSEIVLGTCSICSGPVCLSSAWMSTMPQVPRCKSCGATPQNSYGPTIPMKPSKTKIFEHINEIPKHGCSGVSKNPFTKNKDKLFYVENLPNMEALKLPGGGWSYQQKKIC